MNSKKCNKCDVVKPLDEFGKCSANRTGFQSYCAECSSAVGRLFYEKNKANEQEKARQRYWDNREDRKEYARKYREANTEKVFAATKNGKIIIKSTQKNTENNIQVIEKQKEVNTLKTDTKAISYIG